MRAPALLLAAIALVVTAKRCPDNYQMMGDGRCIRPLYLWHKEPLTTFLPKASAECAADGAHLPFIRNDFENSLYNGILNLFDEVKTQSTFLVLGLVCNPSTRRFEWSDGSTLMYTRNQINLNFDCVEQQQHVVARKWFNDWFRVDDDSTLYTYTILCVKNASPVDAKCGEYSPIDYPKDAGRPCYQIHTESLSWKDAEAQCEADSGALATINSADENKFLWRSAVQAGAVSGAHIGAYKSTSDSASWQWVADDSSLSKTGYNNWENAAPSSNGGSCSLLQTDSSAATWKNEECDGDKRPFVCRRAAYSAVQQDCPVVQPKEGEDIYPPSFPKPSVACEYSLVVAEKKLVELQILQLETNLYSDYLQIYEGADGISPIANLTGSDMSNIKVTTTLSNVMRVNWAPQGAMNVRGFRMRYRAVDP